MTSPTSETHYIRDSQNAYTYMVRRAKLLVITGPRKGTALVVEKEAVSIGTKSENDVVLQDETVSRRHALVVETGGRYLLRDLDSTNGTYLNGMLVKEAYLEFGSTITVGNTRISFVPCEDQVAVYPTEKNAFGSVYGQSVQMRTIFAVLERVAPTDTTIILEGETGTGKEWLARAIHDCSKRAAKPFVVFDCGSVAQSLIESELFGHEKGSFTGASGSREGVFEHAGGGTVFLDEIGELGLDMQPKLLRVLETREVKRVGSNRSEKIDVRVIAATNRDLLSEVQQGRFREDLYYRLSVLRLSIPPLRDRAEDVPLIVQQLIVRLVADYALTTFSGVAPETMEILKSYHWPGNVRELRNVLSRAIALRAGDVIKPSDLMLTAGSRFYEGEGESNLAGKTLDEIEKTAIRQTLAKCDGNKTRAAKVLGIACSTLHEKIKKYHS